MAVDDDDGGDDEMMTMVITMTMVIYKFHFTLYLFTNVINVNK